MLGLRPSPRLLLVKHHTTKFAKVFRPNPNQGVCNLVVVMPRSIAFYSAFSPLKLCLIMLWWWPKIRQNRLHKSKRLLKAYVRPKADISFRHLWSILTHIKLVLILFLLIFLVTRILAQKLSVFSITSVYFIQNLHTELCALEVHRELALWTSWGSLVDINQAIKAWCLI